jgi:hypothetical protein
MTNMGLGLDKGSLRTDSPREFLLCGSESPGALRADLRRCITTCLAVVWISSGIGMGQVKYKRGTIINNRERIKKMLGKTS